MSKIELRLGDIIHITDPKNELIDNQTFFIEYIDDEFTIWTNKERRLKLRFKALETVAAVQIISRSDVEGYALQNGLVVGEWIDVFFDDAVPVIITGEITNSINDMIEITTVDGDAIYLNFDYKGLPQDLNIKSIQLREPIVKEQQGVTDEKEQDEQIEIEEPKQKFKQQLREMILTADQIHFGGEQYGAITQVVDVESRFQRFSIDAQVEDLLDEMMAESKNNKPAIATMIERYKQLRTQFSQFDKFENIVGPLKHDFDYKPLLEYFQKFNHNLQWLLPVVKQTELKCNKDEYVSDIIAATNEYKSSNSATENNKYSALYNKLADVWTSFTGADEEDNSVSGRIVNANITAVVQGTKVQRYNVGLTRMHDKKRVPMTPNERMSVSSFIMLPEPAIRFSRVSLPGTNILDKASLNRTHLNLWQMSKKMRLEFIKQSDKRKQSDKQKQSDKNVNDFSQSVHYLWDGEPFDYDAFVEKITPQIRAIFNAIKPNIKGKLSIVDVVAYLEPFLIYTDSLTFMQYKEIIAFINAEISKFNVRLLERRNKFGYLKKLGIKYRPTHTVPLDAELIRIYDLDNVASSTNSEVLNAMKQRDSLSLYTSHLLLMNVDLMMPREMEPLFEPEEKPITQCENIVVAKKYRTEQELLADNGKPIYFDKKYDTTPYSKLDDYNKQIVTMPTEEFLSFLTNDLKLKMKLTDADADYMAETLINGHKRVVDGQYAMLFNGYKERTEDEYDYYVRSNDAWTKKEKPVSGLASDQPDILCNLQDKCAYVNDKCDNAVKLNVLLNEFDDKYKMSSDEYRRQAQQRNDYFVSIADKLRDLKQMKPVVFQDQDQSGERVVSPYSALLQTILSLTDFEQRQAYIVKFVNKFARRFSNDESPHWLYCVDTDVKLIPAFRYELATAKSPSEYNERVDRFKQTIGKQSDDGDKWVDEHSGWTIVNIEFENTYEDTVTHSVIEADAKIQYASPLTKMISGVVNTISAAMGINLEHQKEFIIGNVVVSLANVPTEEEYASLTAKKTKSVMPYKDVYNSSLLYLTMGMFLVAVQTSVPAIKTRRTFPGCVKSFSGFPLESNGDYSSVEYIACVVYNVRNAVSEPWNALKRVKVTSIVEKVKAFTNDLLSLPEVKQQLENKVRNAILEEDDTEVVQYKIQRMTGFLPPLSMLTMKQVQNVAPEFLSDLIADYKFGHVRQREKLLVLDAKISMFSLAVQERINKIVSKNAAILKTANGEPYLENACCDSPGTTVEYFMKANAEIREYNDVVARLSFALDQSTNFAKSAAFQPLLKKTTTKTTESNNGEFSEETVYMAFIHRCKFKGSLPIPTELKTICREKPDANWNETIGEIINKLKAAGLVYGHADLLKLLQLSSNRVQVDVSMATVDPQIKRSSAIANVQDAELKRRLLSKDAKELDNYVKTANAQMKRMLQSFIGSNTTKKQYTKFVEFTNTMDEWVADESKTKFFQSFIDSFTNIYPTIILNAVDFSTVADCKHWNLAPKHNGQIKQMVAEYYAPLREFYGAPILVDLLQSIGDATQWITNLVPINKEVHEFCLLSVLKKYIELTETAFIVPRTKKPTVAYTVEHNEELETREDVDDDYKMQSSKKELQLRVAQLLLAYMQIMKDHKDVINVSHQEIDDRAFKMREKEKDMVTDRLKHMTDEQREADTILKINKLGDVWSKGLQKGLTKYSKTTFDDELEMREVLDKYERKMLSEVEMEDEMEEDARALAIDAEDNDLTEYRGEDNDYDYDDE